MQTSNRILIQKNNDEGYVRLLQQRRNTAVSPGAFPAPLLPIEAPPIYN